MTKPSTLRSKSATPSTDNRSEAQHMIKAKLKVSELRGGPESEPPKLDGTQAIRRAVAILKIIAAGGYPGVTLSQVSGTLQATRSTTHRILKCLVAEGLVNQDPNEHRYTIGHLTYELSLSVVRDFHVATQWHRLVETVARLTNHTTYLLARSGMDAVCILKADGRAMLRVIPVEVGQRRPLGVGAGAIALLSTFEAPDIERIVKALEPAIRQFPHLSPETVIRDAMEAKTRGYSISRGRVFTDVVGLGFLLPDERGQLTISIAAPGSVVDDKRLTELATTIRAAIAEVKPVVEPVT